MGGNNFVAASHAAMIAACVIGVIRMLGLSKDARQGLTAPPEMNDLPRQAAITLMALAMERGYYLAARRLAPEFDLWSLHPAPAMLSAIVALVIVLESHASLRRRGFVRARVRFAQFRDFAILTALWTAVAYGSPV